MTRFAIGLGSNLGDRLAHLRAGAKSIEDLGVTRWSGLYESAPVGGPEQGPYLNAVGTLESDLSADELLGLLHEIEAGRGRERTVKWGERTLDLDIVTSDGATIESVHLQVPHPRAAERRFVVEPLVDVWPNAPLGEHSAQTLVGDLTDQEVDLLSASWVDELTPGKGRAYVGIQVLWFLAVGVALVTTGSLEWREAWGSRVIGLVFALAGALLLISSAKALGSSLTAVPEPIDGGRLVTNGPFAHARHPIYGGVVLFLAGASLFLGSITAFVLSIAMFPFFWAKSAYEERQLRVRYPGYRAYRLEVKRRFLPFLF